MNNGKQEVPQERQFVNEFDRAIGSLDGVPDVVKTRPTVLRNVPLFGMGSHLYIVQTFRQRDNGDTIFLEHVSGEDTTRLVIPAQVAEAIARQRDVLTAQARSRAAKAVAADRKARGLKPGFMKSRS